MSENVFSLFRRFRHDLCNDLQILSGHVQLGRSTDVLRNDVNTVVERIQEISRLFTCRDDQLALLLWCWQEQARDSEITISFEIEQLSEPVDAERLQNADRLISAAIEQIAGLSDEEHWIHIRVDGSASSITVTRPLFPEQDLGVLGGVVGDIAGAADDGQLEICIPLVCQRCSAQ